MTDKNATRGRGRGYWRPAGHWMCTCRRITRHGYHLSNMHSPATSRCRYCGWLRPLLEKAA